MTERNTQDISEFSSVSGLDDQQNNSSLSSNYENTDTSSDYQPSEERRSGKTRKMTRVRPRQHKDNEVLPAQAQIESGNPLIPPISNSKDLPEVYSKRLLLLLQQLNYNYNGQPFSQFGNESEDTIHMIKHATTDDLLSTAVQLAQRPGVCRISMQTPQILTNLIAVDTRKQAFPFQLPEDGPIRAFLLILQAFGYRNVALADSFADSKIGLLCNYITRYDKNCIDAETQQLSKTVLAGLREEFNRKKDEYEGVTRMGLDQEEAQEIGKTRENRKEAITINYEGTKGEGAREARRLAQMGKGSQWAIQESKKIK